MDATAELRDGFCKLEYCNVPSFGATLNFAYQVIYEVAP